MLQRHEVNRVIYVPNDVFLSFSLFLFLGERPIGLLRLFRAIVYGRFVGKGETQHESETSLSKTKFWPCFVKQTPGPVKLRSFAGPRASANKHSIGGDGSTKE